jgi:two-component system OmpR family sensor kinase
VVRLSAAQDPDHQVLISVRDDGPGIPRDLQADVFERFVRADDSRSRAMGSTGLGLPIARAVILAHGGALTLISDDGGTEFRITLPEATALGADVSVGSRGS